MGISAMTVLSPLSLSNTISPISITFTKVSLVKFNKTG